MKKIKHFLDLDQINAQELRSIVDLSKSYKQGITSSQDTHKGKTLGLIFEKPSTRTRVSFEIAMYQLGGNVTILEHEKTHLGRGETISDTAKVLARYIDIIVYRTSSAKKLYELAEHSTVPVINGLNDETHPCQIIADIMTFEENVGIINNKIITWCGDFNNVCKSWIQASTIFNFKMHLACPKQLINEYEMNKIGKIKNVKIFNVSKIGHAGTLDPSAEGILPIATGKTTKLISLINDKTKVYEFDVKWGLQTTSDDQDGKIIDI